MAEFAVVFQGKTGLEAGDQHLEVIETGPPVNATKMRYVGPYFYCDVKVKATIPAGEHWVIGLMQSCDSIELRHTYQSGNYTQWEFPTPISDFFVNAQASSFPFYSLGAPVDNGRHTHDGTGMVQLAGPQAGAWHNLSMNDNVASNVQWWDPVPNGQLNYNANVPHTLKRIERKQAFSTYVVAHKGSGSQLGTAAGSKLGTSKFAQGKLGIRSSYFPLAQIMWQMHFALEFDCTQALGHRLTSKKYKIGHNVVFQTTTPGDIVLPHCCFVDKCANQVQQLVGYDATGRKVHARIPW
jgi:hypothetical protein